MMIQVIAGACINKYCTSRIETQAKLYNKLSFPILPETVVGTIPSIEKPTKLTPLLATCIQHIEKMIYFLNALSACKHKLIWNINEMFQRKMINLLQYMQTIPRKPDRRSF